MKFENAKAGGKVAGKPYYNPRTPAGEDHYTNLDKFQHVDLIVAENQTKVRGWLIVLLNHDPSPLIRVQTESLVVKENKFSVSFPMQLKRGNFIFTILECESVDGSGPYLIQIRLR